MEHLIEFIVFWGVWLMVPFLIDGMSTLASLLVVLITRLRRPVSGSRRLDYFPLVTIIVPVYNSTATLEACLRSITAQTYPQNQMEVLLIDNGSTDSSFEVFNRLQAGQPYTINWHSIINQGKAWALNAGIHLAHGKYILNVDSDVVLAEDAIEQMVLAMEADSELVAATGGIEILLPAEGEPSFDRVLATCEFFEYVTAFHLGRDYQTFMNNLYTLSGAFTGFRREAISNTFMYNQETVTGDTDLTFDLYEFFVDKHIGCVSHALAYVHPSESIRALYSQRVRWQRGQIEVSARHERLMRRSMWRLRGFSPARVLLVDHTLAFPRMIWTFLLPVLVMFGYPPAMILMAFIVLYFFYTLIDILWFAVTLLGASPTTRETMRRNMGYIAAMPLYRLVIFWFRMSGFLHAIAEPGLWRVSDPGQLIQTGLSDLRSRLEGALADLRVVEKKPSKQDI